MKKEEELIQIPSDFICFIGLSNTISIQAIVHASYI